MPTTNAQWIGDEWIFEVSYVDTAGNAIALNGTTAVPGAELFVGTKTTAIAPSSVTYADNVATFTFTADTYAGVKFTSDTAQVYNALHAFLTDADGNLSTHVRANINVYDPRTGPSYSAPGNMAIVAVAGPQGPPGVSGGAGGSSFVFTQAQASASWIINHNLGRFPSVTLVDTANDLFFGDVTYVSNDQITISLSAATSGRAFCN